MKRTTHTVGVSVALEETLEATGEDVVEVDKEDIQSPVWKLSETGTTFFTLPISLFSIVRWHLQTRESNGEHTCSSDEVPHTDDDKGPVDGGKSSHSV